MSIQEVRDQTHVFISYSRKDIAAAQHLRDRLIEEQFDAYLDVHDIVKGEPWHDRLRGLIERADTVLFLISPESIASEICEWEVNEAELHEKRIFPVVVRATPAADIPQRLQRLNFTFLDDTGKWPQEFPLLLSALNEDVFWVREHTRLGELAARWDRAGQPSRLLLRAADLTAAERWRDQRPANAPLLSPLHAEFLRRSRLGSQRRLRAWLIGASALAVFAVGLSTFAYWQRDLAVQNGNMAERRAAALATDVALSRADQGALNQGLLMLLDASTRYASEPVPEKLLVAMREVTRKALNSRSFWFSSQARAFHLANAVLVADPEEGAIFHIDPLNGDQREVASYRGDDIKAMVLVGGRLVYLASDENLYSVSLDAGEKSLPEHLMSLSADDESPVGWFTPKLHLSDTAEVSGQRIVKRGVKEAPVNELWRFNLVNGDLRRTAVPDNLGELVSVKKGSAYFWDHSWQRMRALQLDTAKLTELSVEQAAVQGVSPCLQNSGQPEVAHIRTLFATVKPGLEQVRCAGLYGRLALMGQTRALARGLMEEFFLFPAGATAAVARDEFWLQNATERLGSLGNDQPFAWHKGSADAGLVAVSHADRIMLLGLRNRYLQSSLQGDGDHVAREIATPDITDGGRFYASGHFAYSGPDAERYRVTVINLAPADTSRGGPVAEHTPERAYWGSCGVQRPIQDGKPGVTERPFSTAREAPGRYRVAFADRSIVVPVTEVRCASLSARSMRLAVVDATGVSLFDVSDDSTEPVLLARIADPSIERVSFLGKQQETLLTAHHFKVMAWRPAGGGRYLGETVYRSKDYLLFAEGAPDGDRMLVWLGLGQADTMIKVVPVPDTGMEWFGDGPQMLVSNPDVFFDPHGAVYRLEQGISGELMSPITLERLRERALGALSPSCRPRDAGDYRSSTCWPVNF